MPFRSILFSVYFKNYFLSHPSILCVCEFCSLYPSIISFQVFLYFIHLSGYFLVLSSSFKFSLRYVHLKINSVSFYCIFPFSPVLSPMKHFALNTRILFLSFLRFIDSILGLLFFSILSGEWIFIEFPDTLSQITPNTCIR